MTNRTDSTPAPGPTPTAPYPTPHAPPRTDRGPHRRWAQLLARVYEVHPLRCPSCHGPMRILAFLTDPAAVRPILRHLRPGDDRTWSA